MNGENSPHGRGKEALRRPLFIVPVVGEFRESLMV